MIVRIVNKKEDYDKFYDCQTSAVIRDNLENGKLKGFLLILEFGKGQGDITIGLSENDSIYYMNDSGKTIAVDNRMLR